MKKRSNIFDKLPYNLSNYLYIKKPKITSTFIETHDKIKFSFIKFFYALPMKKIS